MIEAISARETDTDTKVARLNGGSLKFYSGARPSGTTLGSNTLLASCGIGNPAASGPTNSSGVCTFAPIAPDNSPVASGTITFAFACTSGGTPLYNLSVGLAGSGADIIVDNVVVAGLPVIVFALSFTAPTGT